MCSVDVSSVAIDPIWLRRFIIICASIFMIIQEYGSYDGLGLADLVRTKQVSPRELLDEAIARTEKVDPQINSVVVRHYDYARAQIDNGLADGPFAGVPFLLKDLDLL